MVSFKLGTAELDIEIELNENNIPTLLYVLYGSDLYDTMVDIFINALPPLGKNTGSLSYPTNVSKNHEPATLVLKRLEILADIKPGQKSLTYYTESDIVSYLKLAIGNIIQSCGINASCVNDFGVSSLKPDIMVLTIESIGLPIGIIEVKKPSKNIMENETLNGQTFNYMLSIAEMYGQEDVYCISTTYDCWRVYWLPVCDRSATSSELDVILQQSKTTLEKPVTITSTSNFQDSITTTIDDILPPTPNKLLMKMYYSKRKEEIPLLDVKRMYIQVVESAWFWVNINIKKLHYFIDTPLQLEVHMEEWLCCASKGVFEGQVFVLKFSKSENSPEIEYYNECEKWRELWALNTFVNSNGVIKIVFFDLVLYETNEDIQFIKDSMLNQLFPK
ncbi:hypothetical protein ACTFIY_012664 [Dictyostelium cf. discoideum]